MKPTNEGGAMSLGPWKRTATRGGWNEVEYTSADGRYVIHSRMMASSRNGCWKREWVLWDTARHPVAGRPTLQDFDTLRDAKACCGED
jgi:hypothetical protein